MSNNITEWEFTADVAGWINEILRKFPRLPFSGAKCEQRSVGSEKRRDLTLLDKHKKIILTGEVKLPFRKDGGSPYNEAVVQDARKKAQKAGAKFFFTWNVNECVLWETFPARTTRIDRKYKAWEITSVHKPGHMEMPNTIKDVEMWLSIFIDEFAEIIRGDSLIGLQPPDEKFINALESALKMPVLLTHEELEARYQTNRSKGHLDKWMREEQGWIIRDDRDGIRDNLERASKFSNYALVNKLVFHEALLKRYKNRIGKLSVPEHLDKGDELRLHLEQFFAEAKNVTGDYETVFGEDHVSLGTRIPFYSDAAVPHWRALIDQIHEFDFSKIDYEVIGNIFERLISPEERRKYGQFYTRPEVVDLINSFCINTGIETVMDPACGGGTFLVRAYARKRELAPGRTHGDLLNDLYGIDVSHFAAHLTTINLATRDLIDEENYPQIARNDFFNVMPQTDFLSLPHHTKAKGLGAIQHREIKIPPLDAVVGNPPYIRQEEIPKANGKANGKTNGGPVHGTKDYYQWLIKDEAKVELSGRSDIHCYFWPHAATFLKDNGYLCLLTSSQWLDVEYGFKLQEYILRNFEIVAVIESLGEPWFVGARVATTITILRKQKDEEARMNSIARFVQLRQPIAEILQHDGTTAGAIEAANDLRDKILSLKYNTVNENFRARLIRQGDLWKEGVRLGLLMGKSKEAGSYDSAAQDGKYYGGKWGVYLRAPDLWFELLDNYGANLVPLGKIAEVRIGIITGKDEFFFPIDKSKECLEQFPDAGEFKTTYGVSRKEVELGKVKLCACGDERGEIRPIEAVYLEPEVHSLREVDGFTVGPENCSRKILLVGEKKKDLKGTYVLDYIKWGEKNKWHEGETCKSRVTEDREWYDLTGHERGVLFWSKSQQYKHVIPVNENNLQCNCNLYDIHLNEDIKVTVLGGILNSTLTVLSKHQYGRPVGVEGNLKTEVVDVNMMLVPDPRTSNGKHLKRIERAFNKMKQRKALQFLSAQRMRQMAYRAAGKEKELDTLSYRSELNMPDRRVLDDAVLEMLGITDIRKRNDILHELYSYLNRHFESVRQKEEEAIVNKKTAQRRGKTNPKEIAEQIYNEIFENEGRLLRKYGYDFVDINKPYDVFDIPNEGTPVAGTDLFASQGVKFVKGKKEIGRVATKFEAQDALVILLANSGVRGLARVPREDDEIRRLTQKFEQFVQGREHRIRELIAERTSDEDMQEKIYEALSPLVNK